MDEGFEACFSLRCPACPAHLCAWCLRPAAEGEDPHTHVLDCTEAPEDMRGSALYLHDPPHVPPAPFRKFRDHWRAVHRRRVTALVIDQAGGEVDRSALLEELDALLRD